MTLGGRSRLQSQLLFSVVAALSVTALSIVLIVDAVRTADRMAVSDARQTLASALEQLSKQYGDRVGSDPGWSSLPPEAQELSLGAVARVVFSAYPDLDGGFGAAGGGSDTPLVGAKSTGPDAYPAAMRSAIGRVVASAFRGGSGAAVVPDSRDLLVFEARRIGVAGPEAWAFKRLVGRNSGAIGQREAFLAALGLAGLFSVAGVIATGVRLRQGIGEIQRGLVALETDFAYLLPERNDELGWISGSINRMASARRVLEAERAREQRLRAIGKLVAGVAHEIRNPLNSLRLLLQMMERRLEHQILRREDLKLARSEVDRLNHLLNGLLTFNQAKPPRSERQQVAAVVHRCLALLRPQADERGIRLTSVNADSFVEAAFDAQRLTQAVMNLVLNAIQAAPAGSEVRVGISRAGETVRVTVADSGPGVADDQVDSLFEAFYTTKEDGVGLGLAVSRELVTSMGGNLIYEHGNPGAQFRIDLPAEAVCHG